MKTKYKYIQFVKLRDLPKTTEWALLARKKDVTVDEVLGSVKWYGPWRQYSFFPIPITVFNRTCLEDIAHFIGQLNELRLHELKNKRQKDV